MGSESTGDSPNLHSCTDDRAFLYISSDGTAIGCAIVQRVATAFRVATRSESTGCGGDCGSGANEAKVFDRTKNNAVGSLSGTHLQTLLTKPYFLSIDCRQHHRPEQRRFHFRFFA